MSNSVRPYGRQPARLHRPQDSLGKNTGVGCHFLLHNNPLFYINTYQASTEEKKTRHPLFTHTQIYIIKINGCLTVENSVFLNSIRWGGVKPMSILGNL